MGVSEPGSPLRNRDGRLNASNPTGPARVEWNMTWWRFLMLVLLLVGALADARGRSGGGLGGSRSYRAPSYSRPHTRNALPGGFTSRRSFGVPHFVFLPFFGFSGSGPGLGVLSLLFNLAAVVALIALVVWLVRRFRRR